MSSSGPIWFDIPVLHAAQAIHTPLLTNCFLLITTLGSPSVMMAVTALLLIYVLYKQEYRRAVVLSVGVGGAVLIDLALKLLFARIRPSVFTPLIHETTYSFPSGHAMASSALVFSLIVILWHTKYRLLALILGGIIVLLIGASRVYLGVHYPTDVLAGWLASFIWVMMTAKLCARLKV